MHLSVTANTHTNLGRNVYPQLQFITNDAHSFFSSVQPEHYKLILTFKKSTFTTDRAHYCQLITIVHKLLNGVFVILS